MSAPDRGSPAPASSGARRWLMPMLVASLALNLVIVGAAFSGRFWPMHGEYGGRHRSADLLPRSFFGELDDERREVLAAVFRARKPEFREHRRGLGDAATDFADALEREPFDPRLTQSAVSEHADRSRQLIDLGATVAADLAEALTPEERRTLAQAIRHRLEQDRQRRERRSQKP